MRVRSRFAHALIARALDEQLAVRVRTDRCSVMLYHSQVFVTSRLFVDTQALLANSTCTQTWESASVGLFASALATTGITKGLRRLKAKTTSTSHDTSQDALIARGRFTAQVHVAGVMVFPAPHVLCVHGVTEGRVISHSAFFSDAVYISRHELAP